jgi:hypothetical protein
MEGMDGVGDIRWMMVYGVSSNGKQQTLQVAAMRMGALVPASKLLDRMKFL